MLRPLSRDAAAAHLAEVQQQAGVLLPLLLAAPAAHMLQLPPVVVHLSAPWAFVSEGVHHDSSGAATLHVIQLPTMVVHL